MSDVSLKISGEETVSKAANEAAKGIDTLDKKTDEVGKRAKKTKKEFEDLKGELDETGKSAKGAADGISDVGDGAKKASPQIVALQKQIDKLARELNATKEASKKADVSLTGFGKPLKNVTGLVSRFGGELGSSVGTLGKFGTGMLSTFAVGGPIALGVTAVVSAVSLLSDKLNEASRAAEEATKKQIEGWEAVRVALTDSNDKYLEQLKIRKMISDGLDPRLVEFELEINKLTKEREPLLRAVEVANNKVAESHANMVSAPGNDHYVRAWKKAVDEAAKHQKQLDTIQRNLESIWIQKDIKGAGIIVEDAINGSPLLTPEETRKGIGKPSGKGEAVSTESLREKARLEAKKRAEDAKRANDAWDNAMRTSVEREKQTLIEQSEAALKAADFLKLGEDRKLAIREAYKAKIDKLEKDSADKIEAENQATQDKIAAIIAQGKPLDELRLKESQANRELEAFLKQHPEFQAQAEEARNAIIEDFSRQRKDLAEREAKKLAKETDIWGNDKLTQEEANQKAQYQQGTQWANTLAQGFKDSFESGDAMGIFKASLALVASLLSTFGGPSGALTGGIFGIVSGLFEDGGNPQAIPYKKPPERRSGGPTFTGDFSDGRPFIGHADEFVWSAPAVAGAGGMDRVSQMHDDARLGRSPVASPSRPIDAAPTIVVNGLDAGGIVDTLRRTLNPANVKLLNYRQNALLMSKLRVARV